MACILEELENVLKKQLKKQLDNIKNSKEFKDGAAKAKERVAELSTLLNEVGDMKKAMQGQVKTETDKDLKENKEIVHISSDAKGLGGALTNPTELSKKKGNIEQDYSITYKEKDYISVEAAYQANKVDETKTKPNKSESANYNLMVELITEKLHTYPKLVRAITKLGGLMYLAKAVHQPTKQNTVWETGGKNWFIDALKEAYTAANLPDSTKQEADKSIDAKKTTSVDGNDIESKMRQLLAIYKDQDAPKIGGGLVEDVTRKSVYDEDAKAATMMKGVQDSTLKDMLPKVDGKTINSYERAVNAWYKDMKRGIAIQNKLTEFIELIKTIEYSPELMEELGWSKESTKQETDIIVPTEVFTNNLNKIIDCKYKNRM